MLFVSNNADDIGTVAYALGTGERTVVNKLHYDKSTCGENGFLYASDNSEEPEIGQHFIRSSLEDPQGKAIDLARVGGVLGMGGPIIDDELVVHPQPHPLVRGFASGLWLMLA